jgi:hypothetical protein
MSLYSDFEPGFADAAPARPALSRLLMKPHRSAREPAEALPDGARPWQSVRPGKVKRARKLIRQKGYPSKAALEAIARLLAEKLGDDRG